MKKEKLKTFIIITLVIIIILIFLIFAIKSNNKSKSTILLDTIMHLQMNLSEYLGKFKSDTYEVYTKEQILIGSTDFKNIDKTKIKDYENNEIISLVDFKSKITKNKVSFYKINLLNIDKLFKIIVDEKLNIDIYISNDGKVAIRYIDKPIWWIQEFNTLCIN
ncbi:MAG: hypothetical protein RR290_03165 [Clostridia bacterium]